MAKRKQTLANGHRQFQIQVPVCHLLAEPRRRGSRKPQHPLPHARVCLTPSRCSYAFSLSFDCRANNILDTAHSKHRPFSWLAPRQVESRPADMG